MHSFNMAFEYMLKNECNGDEIVKQEKDTGGMTKYGISLRFLKSLTPENLKKYEIFVHEIATEEDIAGLTLEQAKALYKGEFWDQAPFRKINTQSSINYIFDMAVNMGIAPAVKCAQRACWAVMGSRSFLVDDGIMGNATLDQINQSGTYLLYAMRAERANYYRMVVERNVNQAEFLEGWLNRTYRR